MKAIILIVFLLFIQIGCLTADNPEIDSTVTFQEFIGMVASYHPIFRQADLVVESGEANLRSARGHFDPVLKSNYDQKQFDGKNYYKINNNELKLPTVLGLEFKAGYENNDGVFLNPESNVTENGLAYAGISVPIGKGLFFDERRQALRQAEFFMQATEFERTILLNQLIFDASKVYWDWYTAWNTYQVLQEAVELAQFRLEGVKESFRQGDEPAIDTLEAYILVQNRELGLTEALIRLRQMTLEASNFLWNENLEPLVLTEKAIPIDFDQVEVKNPMEDSILVQTLRNLDQFHPQLLLYANKIEQLNVERRWKSEKLKPKLNLNYNFLSQPVGGNPFEGLSTNDYKWGFEFSMPLLLRKERGDLQITKLKMQDAGLELQRKRLEIRNKIRAYKVELEYVYDQIDLYQNTVDNYQALLRGERRKFEEGESSLFLVNSRENSLITAEVKLMELYGKYQKAQAGLLQAIGIVNINS